MAACAPLLASAGRLKDRSLEHSLRNLLAACHEDLLLRQIFYHDERVTAVAFSPDGKSVVTASELTARLWDRATGQAFGQPLQHQGEVRAASFSPDGKSVVTASFDKTVRIWKVRQLPPGSPEQIVLWSEVRTGLTLDERGDIRVLDAAAWQQRRQRLQDLGGPPEQ